MPEVLRFKTTWGIDPGPKFENWAKWFPTLKAQGYDGVEVELDSVKDDFSILRRIYEGAGLEASALIHSAWSGYLGPRPAGLTVDDHLSRYRQQLEAAKKLKPIRVNSQSGFDNLPIQDAVRFFEGTLKIDAELGFDGKVCHETHRNRSFFNPYVTAEILSQVPQLRVTADISHFVVVCERLLNNSEEDRALLSKIAPHVYHIHSRIGTTQSSQCPDPTNEVFAQERAFFEDYWKQCITLMRDTHDPSLPITFVPEYGPYPYHPFGSARDFSEVADTEGARLHKLFKEWAQK